MEPISAKQAPLSDISETVMVRWLDSQSRYRWSLRDFRDRRYPVWNGPDQSAGMTSPTAASRTEAIIDGRPRPVAV